MNIDWRERDSTTLADLYDGDRHLIMGDGPAWWEQVQHGDHKPVRRDHHIPHPLIGVRYADGVCMKRDDDKTMTGRPLRTVVQQCPFCHDWQLDYTLDDFEILGLVEVLLHEHLWECPGPPACGVERIIFEVPE